jgi:hypothetical protein
VISTHKVLFSPYASTVPGLSIRNSHFLGEDHLVIRGQRPSTVGEISELQKLNVTRILIFRKESSSESSNEDEFRMLKEAKFPLEQVSVIQFPWKDISDQSLGCRQTLEAINHISQARNKGEKLFFHCTVGEDRTGFLSALVNMIFEKKKASEVFWSDMCRYGYAEADPTKPEEVSRLVHANITALFVRMSYLVEHKKISATNLDSRACDVLIDFKLLNRYQMALEKKTNGLRCFREFRGIAN